MNGTIYDLFDAYFRCVDEAYAAFSVAESPAGTPQDLDAAYAAKDRRCEALNTLMAALAERDIPTLAQGILAFYVRSEDLLDPVIRDMGMLRLAIATNRRMATWRL